MKVLNLRCGHEHAFEGWFASDADYESQLERKLVECPMCGDAQIVRMPTAPRLNVSNLRERGTDRKGLRDSRTAPGPHSPAEAGVTRPASERDADDRAESSRGRSTPGALATTPNRDLVDPRSPEHAQALAQAQAEMMVALREVIEKTEDVGDQFPEQARRMHYGEAEQRDIRGVASVADAIALREEGIEVLALPMPPSLKGRLQ